MRGYVLPIILALLLAAPMLWRLDSGVSAGLTGAGGQTARLVFEEMPPSETVAGNQNVPSTTELLTAEPAEGVAGDMALDLLPAAAKVDRETVQSVRSMLVVLPRVAGQD